jgi:very-short-patch-repair endonuclease
MDFIKKLQSSAFANTIHHVIDEHKNIWFCAKDIAEQMNIKNIRSTTKYYDASEKSIIQKHTKGGKQNVAYLSDKGVRRLVCKSRTHDAFKMAEVLGINVEHVKYSCIEADVLRAIKEAFDGECMLEQYIVDTFRIDLYMPKFELAIECDEDAHRFNKPEDNKREQCIRNVIPNVTFIRVCPQEDSFNIYKTINIIYHHIICYT